eukprot:8669831-Prorocentrum_lima.AAC.1
MGAMAWVGWAAYQAGCKAGYDAGYMAGSVIMLESTDQVRPTRTVPTQSQCTYKRWWKSPRF